jgi:dCMP deaminase
MRAVPSWNEYFISIAIAVSKRSKDPNTQVGSVIVNPIGHIISTGFNGFPPGIEENNEKWEKPEKYKWVIHSEQNAIAHCETSARNSTIYTTLYPCLECTKIIIAAGIKRIVYLDNKYFTDHANNMMIEAGVEIIQIK